MGRSRIKSFLLATLLVLLSSCSIKEDRTLCPCWLIVDLSKVLDAGTTPPSLWDQGLCIALFSSRQVIDSLSLGYEEAHAEYGFHVAKGDVGVVGMLGLDCAERSGHTIWVTEGCQADKLYLSTQLVACYGEEARAILDVKKQFSRVEIWGLDSFRCRMEVTAGCSGLDLLTAEALEGPFRYPLVCEEDGACRFRMPRQREDDLKILLYDADGHLDNSIPLGRYMTDIGFDWDAPSLADVSIRVDFVTATVNITVGDWTHAYVFPYTL